ncbi:NADP-dependent phosphogluconate dehydrogenase [Danxiaibacter flavus]|uniref:6-phosphogluconate dehydrogenase, decarboxylating n=1 Tax=Danxiaibacter flavus TaxID=3049108 RepID=A0ABV3ZQ23_9BACT|nr:NADP-dependent phosphogluconate dehydrogenase [Chitinophagaceae bacterium DXS]
MNTSFDFGMVGLGVMGRNLLLNIADHGFSVIGFDKDAEKGASLESSATAGTTVKGVTTLEEMVKQLAVPRKIMMLVPAGKPVDDVIDSLLPLLDQGDLIIDGGNSHYTDTLRRIKYVSDKGFHFMGTGISGGEFGARTGPSIMPGGDIKAWEIIKPIFESIAAHVDGEPCVAYMGKGAAGHFVKMVHNGIEYAVMQLICEIYDLLHRGSDIPNDRLHEIFKSWNEGELKSYLVEITADILKKKDPITGNFLVDMINDKAGSKGTGIWTSQDALNLPVAIPTIDAAVAMRTLSGFKDERILAARLYKSDFGKITDAESFIKQAEEALFAAILISYAQGLAMLKKASEELDMAIELKAAVKVWRGGCIIRSVLLEDFYESFSSNPQLTNILLDTEIVKLLDSKQHSLRAVVAKVVESKIGGAALMSTLAYFDAFTTEKMPTNLVQAQRDYFGAHTYQRIDKEGIFHTEDWAS